MKSLIIKEVRAIDPSQNLDTVCDILIIEDKIAKIGKSLTPPEGALIIEGRDKTAAPGLVDIHVHLRDPGFTHKEDILTGCGAAAAGGVTSVLSMPNTNPSADNPETIAYIIEKAKQAPVRVYPAAAITAGQKGKELCDFALLKQSGAAAFTDDGRPVESADLMKKAIKLAGDLNAPIISHSEDLKISAGGIINEGKISSILKVKGIPAAAEEKAVARDIALTAETGCPIHIAHVSTKGAVELIRAAKAKGVKVTAETAPHYFTLTEEGLINRDANWRMNPPLRTADDVKAIKNAITDGTIDAIATDHAPHTKEEKADFEKAPNGVIGLETSLAVGITYLVKTGLITLPRLIYLMSTAPAGILKINAGTLSPGSPADIVIFDENEKWTVDPEKLRSKSKNTPFAGQTLSGRVKYTICGGKIVYADDQR